MPDMETKLYTEKGDAYCQKIDIFKEIMWFSYANAPANWLVLPVEKVKEILAVNKKKERVANLEDYVVETTQEIEKKFENVVGQDSLTRFDQPKKKPNNRNKKKKPTTTKNAPKKD